MRIIFDASRTAATTRLLAIAFVQNKFSTKLTVNLLLKDRAKPLETHIAYEVYRWKPEARRAAQRLKISFAYVSHQEVLF